MDETLYFHALALKAALDNNHDVKLLQQMEQKVNENEEIFPLLQKYQSLQAELNEKLSFYDVDSLAVKELRQALAEMKYTLDTHPEISVYNSQFRIVSAIYKNISRELFAEFSENKGFKCH